MIRFSQLTSTCSVSLTPILSAFMLHRLLLVLVLAAFVSMIGASESYADRRRGDGYSGHYKGKDRSHRPRGRYRHERWGFFIYPYDVPPYFNRSDWAWWNRGRWYNGHHHGHYGWWWVIGGAWYYYPAPIYPYPAPVAVYSGPAPAPVPMQPQNSPAPYCREYQGDAIVNGTNQRFYGTACLQPDGAWHIVP